MGAAEFVKSIFGDCKVVNCSHGGVCACCGGCCSDILPITKKESDTLRHFVQTHNYKPNTRVSAVLVNPYDMTCPFLNKECRCDVYDIRPQVCRLFRCWTLTPSKPEDWAKLPKHEREPYFRWAQGNPQTVSLRQTIFGEQVPF